MATPKIKTVGSCEAKIKFASLLDEVAKGSEIVIIRRGKPVARLVPIVPECPGDNVFDRIRSLRGTLKLPKGETVKDLINAGRRI